MNLGTNDRIKASEIVQANANSSGESRWMHMYNGVFWQSKECPKDADPQAQRFDPQVKQSLVVQLVDQSEEHSPAVRQEVTIEASHNEIMIGPADHGVANMQDDFNHCIVMEFYEGKFRLLVWGDVNQEDPTHVIDMDGARNAVRKEYNEVADVPG